ncbi:hypothetical protein RHGRI_016839 [Rhododendron griersonianum]|uniref:Uncharacterized protein n=1 Tax=Rhododendron griersonianum TaxID=479676 RepID=A0AAV6JVN5_9ERIC|nr:hypothetical protein RHGRI_016839 [Rhododendron griersonianum]
MRSVRRGSIAVGVDRGPKEQNHSWKQKDSGQIGVTGIRPVPRVGFATLVRHLHPLECYLAQPTAYLDSPACGLSPIGLHPSSLVRFSGDLAAASPKSPMLRLAGWAISWVPIYPCVAREFVKNLEKGYHGGTLTTTVDGRKMIFGPEEIAKAVGTEFVASGPFTDDIMTMHPTLLKLYLLVIRVVSLKSGEGICLAP